jgi:hypothetical protein
VLLVGSTSMADVIKPCIYSTTSIGSMGASNGEGIASTSTDSLGFLVFCLASDASHGTLSGPNG